MTATIVDKVALSWRIRDALTELRRARNRCDRKLTVTTLGQLEHAEAELDRLLDTWPRP